MYSPLWPLLASFSWQELRSHPWRNAAAVVSVMLGVALAFSVHLINTSALDEFASAARSVGGQPDLSVQASAGPNASISDALLGRMMGHPDVQLASPVLELSTYAWRAEADPAQPLARSVLRIVGIDALQIARMTPDLMPVLAPGADRLDLLAPNTVFLNGSAQASLGNTSLQLQHGMQRKNVTVAGSVGASGAPLAVMDIAAAQDLFDRVGQLTRVDVRLRAGVDRKAFAQHAMAQPDWPSNARLVEPSDSGQRMANLSRAYRVNLTVLALVALFTGGYLVFSVLALSVSRRAPQFALLGVLGLTAAQRLRLVLLEACALGLLGSVLGVALGVGLAAMALHWLGGDLGGGFFGGTQPSLQWSTGAAAAFGALGVLAACVGAWWPARWVRGMAEAQTLKGLGTDQVVHNHGRWALVLLGGGALMALVPPIGGMPLAAYVSVGMILVGGIAGLPWLVGGVLNQVAPWFSNRALPLLAIERARRVRASAAVAVSGVVAALSLAVALTVMVASFRASVSQWLDAVLPADLYVRTAMNTSTQDTAYLEPEFVAAARQIAGVQRLSTQRTLTFLPAPDQPAVAVIVRPRPVSSNGEPALPLLAPALPVPQGQIGIYVSEAMVDLHGARPGTIYAPLSKHFEALAPVEYSGNAIFFVAGVWRDYARQFGSIALAAADFEKLTADTRVNDLALWLQPGADATQVEAALRAAANGVSGAAGSQAADLLEIASAQSIRGASLRIFDRSFAVTVWLQGVAIAIGLFGVAASFSAQVLARRKEFGLLVHLGLTRGQILRIVAIEGLAWTTLGALAGIVLGLAVALVLVHVVNPQSFHWTMDLVLPEWRLLGLAVGVIAAGTLTAWFSGRSAAGQDAVQAVKEDW